MLCFEGRLQPPPPPDPVPHLEPPPRYRKATTHLEWQQHR
jgi:hypothetical protein